MKVNVDEVLRSLGRRGPGRQHQQFMLQENTNIYLLEAFSGSCVLKRATGSRGGRQMSEGTEEERGVEAFPLRHRNSAFSREYVQYSASPTQLSKTTKSLFPTLRVHGGRSWSGRVAMTDDWHQTVTGVMTIPLTQGPRLSNHLPLRL